MLRAISVIRGLYYKITINYPLKQEQYLKQYKRKLGAKKMQAFVPAF